MSAKTLGDPEYHSVWKVRALKRQSKTNEATDLLWRIAHTVRPIMRRRKWRVPTLSEMMPKNANLLGLNVNRGVEIKIRLRPASDPNSFLPFESLLHTMLHELTHIVHGPHNAKFYSLLDGLIEECERLVNGITTPFDGDGKKLGGRTSAGSRAELRTLAHAAAVRRGTMGPPGGYTLGSSGTARQPCISPREAAVRAAERRRRDEEWCPSQDTHSTHQGEDSENGFEVSISSQEPQCQPPDIPPPLVPAPSPEWACIACTFLNDDPHRASCELCFCPRVNTSPQAFHSCNSHPTHETIVID